MDSPTACFDVEAGGTWNRLPGKSTAVETPLLDTPLNLYEGLGVKLLLSSTCFEVVRIEGSGLKTVWCFENLVALYVADVVELEDLFLREESSLAK